MCPRGRPRGQGRPRGLHLCTATLAVKIHCSHHGKSLFEACFHKIQQCLQLFVGAIELEERLILTHQCPPTQLIYQH